MIITKSFTSIIGENPKVLILGTLPSKKSLELQQYYGHPRNSFWRILFTLFDNTFSSNYHTKKLLAIEHNIAIWDVCYTAIRKGSLDSAIKDEIPNKIDELIEYNPSINTIAFNGQKAARLYDKYFSKFDNINYITLLSTSPANAKYSFEEKLKDWNQIKKIIDTNYISNI
ncbi:MAG: DNA-deoxyinosine glycosylase [Candidatus Marinimicrobia bacterium]|nr:DNA-deoxyinosine glycosylase [Candidatus Neomarinimicrobiota bacterium]